MINFTHKMALMEFQVHSASKICYLKDVVKICVTNIILSRIEEQVEIMIKSGIVENRQTTQGLAPFCFSHQNILFFLPVLFYKPQISMTVFLVSQRISTIMGPDFYNWFLEMMSQLNVIRSHISFTTRNRSK